MLEAQPSNCKLKYCSLRDSIALRKQVATVKLGQEASEAAAAAVLEARATGASEEEVKAAAAAAAAEAASKSELMSRSRHHVGDAQSRYYRWNLSNGGLGGIQAHSLPGVQALQCQKLPAVVKHRACTASCHRTPCKLLYWRLMLAGHDPANLCKPQTNPQLLTPHVFQPRAAAWHAVWGK